MDDEGITNVAWPGYALSCFRVQTPFLHAVHSDDHTEREDA